VRRVVVVAVLASLAVGAAPAAAAPSSGFNDWSCRPSTAHPEPLVLLHGLGANGAANYAYLGPYLAGEGYCAFAPDYGSSPSTGPFGGTAPIDQSSREIADFVARVRSTTGAAKVDIVGHSEGGFQSLYGPKVRAYAAEVRRVVALAPPTHGTTFASLVTVAELLGVRKQTDELLNAVGCAACADLIRGGAAVARLNDGPIAQPGIAYTIIASRFDALVTPTDTAFVREPGVTNEYVQDTCPLDPVGHVGLAFDGGVARIVANALDPDHARPVACGVGLPL
jgi:pimeloyl-ACP methyl ester carboxylesterase